jgi:hypothetical protein
MSFSLSMRVMTRWCQKVILTQELQDTNSHSITKLWLKFRCQAFSGRFSAAKLRRFGITRTFRQEMFSMRKVSSSGALLRAAMTLHTSDVGGLALDLCQGSLQASAHRCAPRSKTSLFYCGGLGSSLFGCLSAAACLTVVLSCLRRTWNSLWKTAWSFC